ncbi:hypothetical protein [bacterium endosymbiont of Pedicinus badii]|nr:hypothetical protein [bacterium endosymbiont of Pedicinus badii]
MSGNKKEIRFPKNTKFHSKFCKISKYKEIFLFSSVKNIEKKNVL